MRPASAPSQRLSERESEIVGLAAQGLLDKEIAVELAISTNTLRTYWGRIRAKLGRVTRSGLVAAWLQDPTSRPPMAAAPFPLLQETWWQSDHVRQVSLASDYINGLFGLAPGVPHSFEEYDEHFAPEDLSRKERVLEIAEARMKGSVVYSGRAKVIDGFAYFYTVATLSYVQGKLARSHGHTIVVDAETMASQWAVGMWVYNRTTDEFHPDSACRRFFGVRQGAHAEVGAFCDRVATVERYALESVLRGVGEFQDVLVGVRTSSGGKFHVRAVSSPSLAGSEVTVGTMLSLS